MNAPRCNYCGSIATVWFSYQSWVRSRGHHKALTITVSACDEHRDCTNFKTNLDLHPEAKLQNAR
jgi:hypothetical protein